MDSITPSTLRCDAPRFLPSTLIHITAYDGKPRFDLAEVYEVGWNYAKGDWLYKCRCFVGEGEAAKFRKFWGKGLVAD